MAEKWPLTARIGFWMAVPIGALQAFNAARAALDPLGFADYLGVPLEAAGDSAWVHVYALRTGFIALLVLGLLVGRALPALAWVAVAALLIPAGDGWLAHSAGAPTSTVIRHVAILAYLLITAALLVLGVRAMRRTP